MIAADTGTWFAFLQGKPGDDVQFLDKALEICEFEWTQNKLRVFTGAERQE